MIVRVLYLGAVCAAVQLATGCGRWPSVRAIGDVEFMRQGGDVRSVEVLPIDVSVSTYPASPEPAEQIAARFDGAARAAVVAMLERRGYRVAAQLDWEGGFTAPDGSRGAAFTREEMEGTTNAMATFGRAQEAAPGLVSPDLPARLGRAGGDATLYVGGFAHAGEDGGITVGDVAKGVIIALFIVVVVAVIIISAQKGFGGGGGKVSAPPAPNRVGSLRAAAAAGRLRGVPPVGRVAVHGDTAVDVTIEGPPQSVYDSLESTMLLDMTLVDNRTGETLWHSRQEFPASAADDGQVVEAVTRMMMTLPQR